MSGGREGRDPGGAGRGGAGRALVVAVVAAGHALRALAAQARRVFPDGAGDAARRAGGGARAGETGQAEQRARLAEAPGGALLARRPRRAVEVGGAGGARLAHCAVLQAIVRALHEVGRGVEGAGGAARPVRDLGLHGGAGRGVVQQVRRALPDREAGADVAQPGARLRQPVVGIDREVAACAAGRQRGRRGGYGRRGRPRTVVLADGLRHVAQRRLRAPGRISRAARIDHWQRAVLMAHEVGEQVVLGMAGADQGQHSGRPQHHPRTRAALSQRLRGLRGGGSSIAGRSSLESRLMSLAIIIGASDVLVVFVRCRVPDGARGVLYEGVSRSRGATQRAAAAAARPRFFNVSSATELLVGADSPPAPLAE